MKNKKGLLTYLLLTVTAASLAGCKFFHKDESVSISRRNYTMHQMRIAEQNTFKKLNDIHYPSYSSPDKSDMDENWMDSYVSFVDETYRAIINSSNSHNLSYSSVGLYSLLNNLYGAASREDLKDDLDALLGLDALNRSSFYRSIMKANSYANEYSTTQLKNAAFFNNSYQYNQDFVDILTQHYCEAYQLNFAYEANKIVEWVNKAVNADNFIDTNFLEISKDSELYLFSTLYFKNMWAYKYLSSDTSEGNFYLNDGSVSQRIFMKHSYMIESYYDYGSYISFKDYFRDENAYSDNASITYLIPKRLEDNIYDLTKDVNIFKEDESKLVKDESEYPNYFTVNLKTPKFKIQSDVDFKKSLSSLGFADAFNPDFDSFKNAFNDEQLNEYNIYISVMKQRNQIEFNEDGSIVTSVSMAGLSKAESAAFIESKTLDIDLNQPFIYIIRDCNDIPIFVGRVDNPIR